jgi:hypothetical protein
MKVYVLYFSTYGHGMFGSINTRKSTLGIYASEDAVKREIATIKENYSTNSPSATVSDRPDGRGFSVSSYDCAPGWWEYEEQEVME